MLLQTQSNSISDAVSVAASGLGTARALYTGESRRVPDERRELGRQI